MFGFAVDYRLMTIDQLCYSALLSLGAGVLFTEAASALKRMNDEDPGVNALVRRGYGYALFPTVTKGGLVVGGAHGQGVLYEQGRHTAYCDLTQATVGAQVGAQ